MEAAMTRPYLRNNLRTHHWLEDRLESQGAWLLASSVSRAVPRLWLRHVWVRVWTLPSGSTLP